MYKILILFIIIAVLSTTVYNKSEKYANIGFSNINNRRLFESGDLNNHKRLFESGDLNNHKRLFEFDYDYQLDPIRYKNMCPISGLVDEYYGGRSDAYKDRYIPYILNCGFNELNRDY